MSPSIIILFSGNLQGRPRLCSESLITNTGVILKQDNFPLGGLAEFKLCFWVIFDLVAKELLFAIAILKCIQYHCSLPVLFIE